MCTSTIKSIKWYAHHLALDGIDTDFRVNIRYDVDFIREAEIPRQDTK